MKTLLIVAAAYSIVYYAQTFSNSTTANALHQKNTLYISNSKYAAPPPAYFIKFNVNGVSFTTRFIDPASLDYQQLFLKYLTDSTTAIRTFEKTSDSIVISGDFATFQFDFYKSFTPSNYKQVYFYTDTKFEWAPKAYKVVDYDLDYGINPTGFDGLAEYRTHNSRLLSYQYSWVTHHRPASFTITSVDTKARIIRGTFSFTATYTEAGGNTVASQKNTYTKVIEADITGGEFCLPYTILPG